MNEDPIDIYLHEKLGIELPIINLIHHITYQKLYELIAEYPEWLNEYEKRNHIKPLRIGRDGRLHKEDDPGT